MISSNEKSAPRARLVKHRRSITTDRRMAQAVPTMELWSYPGEGGWYAPLARTEVTVVSFDALVEQLRHFLAVIAGREMPLISVGDAMSTLAVVEAVHEAARTGGRISPGRTVEQAE